MTVVGVVLLVVGLLIAAVSGGVFSAKYRYLRRATRWMKIPVPFSPGMWVAVIVLGVSEAAAVVGIVLLVTGAQQA